MCYGADKIGFLARVSPLLSLLLSKSRTLKCCLCCNFCQNYPKNWTCWCILKVQYLKLIVVLVWYFFLTSITIKLLKVGLLPVCFKKIDAFSKWIVFILNSRIYKKLAIFQIEVATAAKTALNISALKEKF